MIKKKLARMAAETYAAESAVFRTAANVEQARRSADSTEAAFKAIEEYTIEASLAKIHGSEVLAMVVDEGVQIFGGYGFMHEYPSKKPTATPASSASSRGQTRSTAWWLRARSSNAL